MKIKQIVQWILLISLTIVSWSAVLQWAMLQKARLDCFHLAGAQAEMIYFTAYCNGTFEGFSAVIKLSDLQDMYDRNQPVE